MSGAESGTEHLARRLADCLRLLEWRLAVAESCTGGSLAGLLTEIPGSSAWFNCGFVSYSNQSKFDLLDVPLALTRSQGAVSKAVARAMAEGALRRGRADLAVAVTGVAGPAGGTPEQPVGSVWLAWARDGLTLARAFRFDGDRAAVRAEARRQALLGLLEMCPRES